MVSLSLNGPLALDANCLSYFLLGGVPGRREKMRAALLEAAPFGIQFSVLAAAEVMVEPVLKGDTARFERVAGILAAERDFRSVDMTIDVAQIAARIRGATRISLQDAVVVASAIAGGADLLLSNDRQVVRVAREYLRAVYFDDWDPDAPEPS